MGIEELVEIHIYEFLGSTLTIIVILFEDGLLFYLRLALLFPNFLALVLCIILNYYFGLMSMKTYF